MTFRFALSVQGNSFRLLHTFAAPHRPYSIFFYHLQVEVKPLWYHCLVLRQWQCGDPVRGSVRLTTPLKHLRSESCVLPGTTWRYCIKKWFYVLHNLAVLYLSLFFSLIVYLLPFYSQLSNIVGASLLTSPHLSERVFRSIFQSAGEVLICATEFKSMEVCLKTSAACQHLCEVGVYLPSFSCCYGLMSPVSLLVQLAVSSSCGHVSCHLSGMSSWTLSVLSLLSINFFLYREVYRWGSRYVEQRLRGCCPVDARDSNGYFPLYT